jgi:hypothetical protein
MKKLLIIVLICSSTIFGKVKDNAEYKVYEKMVGNLVDSLSLDTIISLTEEMMEIETSLNDLSYIYDNLNDHYIDGGFGFGDGAALTYHMAEAQYWQVICDHLKLLEDHFESEEIKFLYNFDKTYSNEKLNFHLDVISIYYVRAQIIDFEYEDDEIIKKALEDSEIHNELYQDLLKKDILLKELKIARESYINK